MFAINILKTLGFLTMISLFLQPVPQVEAAETGTNAKGIYTLERAPKAEILVSGIALPALLKAHLPDMRQIEIGLSGRWGRFVTLLREGKQQVRITIGVYSGVAEAEDAALDLLNDMSAVFSSGSKSGRTIGTHSWYLTSVAGPGTLVFVYNNALVQVFASGYELAEHTALAIIDDLVEGRNGVTLGRSIQQPQVTDAILPAQVGQKGETIISVKAVDPNQRALSYSVSARMGQVLSTKEDSKRIYVSTEVESDQLEIYAINDLNVVSKAFYKNVIIVPRK